MSCSDFDLLSVLTPEIWAMKVLGFWKSENNNSMYSSFFYKTYRSAIWLGMTIFQVFGYMFVYQKWHTISIGDISSVMFLNVSIFNVQLVTTCIFFNLDRLHIIIHQLTSDILQLKTERHVQIAKQLKKSGDFIRKYYYSLLIFILLVQPALKLLSRDKEPFYASYIPPVLGHIGVLVFQEIITAVAGYAGCNYCCLDMNLMTGISIQIDTLKDILCESDDIEVIFECIERHQQIVR
nr:unnamed protein product [Callosobruchus chinensis]